MESTRVIEVSCNETDPRIDPARYFNLSTTTTQVVKTAGGRAGSAINNIYYADQASRLGMIVVLQHTGCPSNTGDLDTAVRADIQALKDSPYVRNDIPIIGYMLDTGTSQLREVSIVRNAPDAEARRRVLSQMDDFGPFWN
ncbi:hypothetical protein FB567DRAFT_173082 [Paraphoma chrysanthemicola]|uniref:Carbonic anhydrase n=1 Tax=Paraphoma chrysanthemicola TaxID=798071 RepID=A0A8K0RFZ5_9PLEO|nr:hypothetical protein FB567DRAFT_173082 [Paraphoma chrysanthemicola]